MKFELKKMKNNQQQHLTTNYQRQDILLSLGESELSKST